MPFRQNPWLLLSCLKNLRDALLDQLHINELAGENEIIDQHAALIAVGDGDERLDCAVALAVRNGNGHDSKGDCVLLLCLGRMAVKMASASAEDTVGSDARAARFSVTREKSGPLFQSLVSLGSFTYRHCPTSTNAAE